MLFSLTCFPQVFQKRYLNISFLIKCVKKPCRNHNFISPYEKNIIQQCLQRRSFDDEIVQDLCDILSNCSITNLPSPSNIQVMILDAGKKVFIQRPFFVLKNIKIGLGEFWKVINHTYRDWYYLESRSTNTHQCFEKYRFFWSENPFWWNCDIVSLALYKFIILR